jgi:hypothetical protein
VGDSKAPVRLLTPEYVVSEAQLRGRAENKVPNGKYYVKDKGGVGMTESSHSRDNETLKRGMYLGTHPHDLDRILLVDMD